MTQNQISVSFIVPVRDDSRFLDSCLDRLCNQSLQNIEIICVCDGSKDASSKIIQEYALADRRIQLIEQKKTGIGHALNVGIEQANGKYIGIIFPEEKMLPNFYENQFYKVLQYNVDLVLKTDIQNVEETLIVTKNPAMDGESEKQLLMNTLISSLRIHEIESFIQHFSTCLIRRDMITANQIRFNEINDWNFQEAGFIFQAICHSSVYYVRKLPNNIKLPRGGNTTISNFFKLCRIKTEFDFIKSFVDKSNNKDIDTFYHYLKYQYFIAYYQRSDEENKLPFLKIFSADFKSELEKSELDMLYFNDSELKNLNAIIEDPINFYIRDLTQRKIDYFMEEKTKLTTELEEIKFQLNDVQRSIIFRSGRFITKVPRMLRDIFLK